jgi:lysozyme family protein
MQFTPTVRLGYSNLWARAHVLPQHKAELTAICKRFIANRARYAGVEKITGVPWWWVACVHERESGCNFATHLANGDPLNEKTTHVPAGRGPFLTWEAGAADALRYMGLDQIKDWSLPSALYQFERYNGQGYTYRNINSPYVWSFTDLYSKGKFGSDGQFSPSLIDSQPGCAAMLNILLTLLPGLLTQVLPQMTTPTTVSSVPAAPIAPTSTAGLNTSNAAILMAAVTSIISSLFAVGSPVAILLHGASWWHVIGAGLTFVAGMGATIAPLAGLLSSNAETIVNTVSATAGTIAGNVAASTQPAPQA